jgi:hypothetical protein
MNIVYNTINNIKVSDFGNDLTVSKRILIYSLLQKLRYTSYMM